MKQHAARCCIIIFSLALCACGSKPAVEPMVVSPTVAISSPSVDVFVRGSVTFQVVVGESPDSVDLLKDGAVLATLVPPYTYVWDTALEMEKVYSITARANKAGAAAVLSAPRQVTVDRTAPTVVSRVPGSGAMNVFLADEMSVTFNEPLLASSVTSAGVQLKQGANVVTTTATPDATGTKVILKPTVLPSLSATLKVVLNGLTDRAGNVLAPVESTFGAPDWQSPGTQPLNATNAGQIGRPALAFDAQGHAVAAWSLSDVTLAAARFVDGVWTSLGTTSGSVASMALDSSGNPVVAFAEYICCSNEFKYDIHVKQWAGSAWAQLGTTLDVHKNVALVEGLSSVPSIAIGPDNNPVVAWNEYNEITQYNAYVKRWNGTAWVSLGSSLNTVSALEVAVTIDSNGKPVAAFTERDGTNKLFVKRWDGIAWRSLGSALNVSALEDASRILLAPGSNGNVVVAWAESSVYVKEWNGTAWNFIGNAVIPGSSYQRGGSLAVAPDGSVVFALGETDGATPSALNVRRSSGASWVMMGTSLNVNAAKEAVFPAVALDKTGTPWVSWLEVFDLTKLNVHVKRLNRIP
jgi:hypothetical protein